MRNSQMSGYLFEDYVETILKKMGFRVTNKGYSNDGGIDLIAEYDKHIFKGTYIIQCKNWQAQVGQPSIRDLYGVTMSEHANKGILITTSDFSDQAKDFAKGKNIELINGQELNQIAQEYGFSKEKISGASSDFYDAKDFDKDLYLYHKNKITLGPLDSKYYIEIIVFLHDYIVKGAHYTLKDVKLIDEYIKWNQSCIKNCYYKKTHKNKIYRAGRNASIAWALSLKGNIEESLELIVDIEESRFGSYSYGDMKGVGHIENCNGFFNYLYNLMNILDIEKAKSFITSFYEMKSSEIDYEKFYRYYYDENMIERDEINSYFIQNNVLAPKRFLPHFPSKGVGVITITTYKDEYLDIKKIVENYNNIENTKKGILRFLQRHNR